MIKQRMTQMIFKCFADLLHSSILSNQERIGLHYSSRVHFFLLILERGLHLQTQACSFWSWRGDSTYEHTLLPFDVGEGTPLTRTSFTQANTLQAHLLELQHTMHEDS